MSLCPLLILPISCCPSLSIPSYYFGFSLCCSLPYVPLIFLQLLFVCVWLFCPHFFPSGFYSQLCECHFLYRSLVFYGLFLSPVELDRQLALLCGAEWVLWACIQLDKDHQPSFLTTRRKITGAGFVSGWFTDTVTIQALV